jgi:phage I-like protein
MKNQLAQMLSSAVFAAFNTPIGDVVDGGSWVQILPNGTFSARDGRGPYTTGDKASMQRIVANSVRFKGSTDIVIDYDHQSVFGAVPGVGGKAPAAGWIKELQVRDDGIYGRVEWTEAAASAIKSKEYRYLSPVYAHDRKTGNVILVRMAALTNTPGLDLEQVALSAFFTFTDTNENTGETMKKLFAALGLAEGTSEDAAVVAVQSLMTGISALAVMSGLTPAAKIDDVVLAVQSTTAHAKAVALAAGLAENAPSAEVVVAVQSAVASATVDPAKYVPVDVVVAMQTQLNALTTATLADKAETAVMKAIEEGKVSPALKDWALNLAKKDMVAFEAFTAKAPSIKYGQVVPPKTGDASEPLSQEDTAIMTQLGLSEADFIAQRKKETE